MVEDHLGLRCRLFYEAFYIKVICRYHELDVVKVTKNSKDSCLVLAFQGVVVSQDFLYATVVSLEISMGPAFCWQDHVKLVYFIGSLIFLVWQVTEEGCFGKFLILTNMVIISLGKGTLPLSPC